MLDAMITGLAFTAVPMFPEAGAPPSAHSCGWAARESVPQSAGAVVPGA